MEQYYKRILRQVLTAVMVGGMALNFVGCRQAPTSPPEESNALIQSNEMANTEINNPETIQHRDKNQDEMEALLASIQAAIYEGSVIDLSACIDPKYSKECFLVAAMAGLNSEAYEGLIPIVSEIGKSGRIQSPSEISLSFVSEVIQDNEGILKYTVETNGTHYEETVNVTNVEGQWFITDSYENDYLSSLLNNGGFGEFPYSCALSNVDLETLETFQRGRAIGFCTAKKDEVLQPYFSEVGRKGFVDGYCPVKMGNHWGFINTNGALVVNYLFDDLYEAPIGNFWWGCVNDKWGAVNFETDEIVSCQYDEILGHNESLLSVSKDGLCGVIASNGEIMIPLQYETVGIPSAEDAGNALIPVKKGEYWGVLDIHNSVIVDYIFTEMSNCYVNGVLGVGINNAHGAINEAGEYVVRIDKKYWTVDVNRACIILCDSPRIDLSSTKAYLFDFNGNPLFSGEAFEPGYFSFSNGNIIVIPDTNPKMTKGYMVKTDGTCIDLSNTLYDSLANSYPEKFQIAKNDDDSSCYINEALQKDVVHVGCSLMQGFSYLLHADNLIDSEGNLLFSKWPSQIVAFSSVLVNDYIVYQQETKQDNAISYDWYMLRRGDDPVNADFLGSSPNHTDAYDKLNGYVGEWDDGQNKYYIIRSYYYRGGNSALGVSYNIISINDKKLYSLSDYAGVDFDLFLADRDEEEIAPVVTDGIFYGLLTKDGLVGDGVAYTDYSYTTYDGSTSVYTFMYGAEKKVSFRILPDGSAVEIDTLPSQ